MKQTLVERIEALATPPLMAMGLGVVRVLLSGEKRKILQIMIERADEQPVSIDDCVEVSHCLSAILDVEDPIEGHYNLEVSSPGLERPLIKLRDFARFQGRRAKVESREAVEGRKRFVGVITEVEGEQIHLQGEDFGEVVIPYEQIHKAKLVFEG